MDRELFDCAVIGGGLAGLTLAIQLSEKGYSVAVLEKGKRFRAEDFPLTNWNVRKYLWAPLLKCFVIIYYRYYMPNGIFQAFLTHYSH